MTGVLEAPVAVPAPEVGMTDAAPRGGGWTRLRVDLRLARRQAARAWGSSLLVVALVAMPMALLTGGAIFGFSRLATPEQKITAELGHSDAWLQVVGGPDPSRWQNVADPWWNSVERDDDNVPVNPELPPIDDVTGLLPPGTRVIEIALAAMVAETPGGLGNFEAIIGEAWDPALDGRFEFLTGRAPANAREAMVSPGALDRLDAAVGDTLTLAEPHLTFTIVGVLKSATQPDSAQSLYLPAAGALTAAVQSRTWFTPDWQPTADELPALNHEGVIAYARDLVADSPGIGSMDASAAWTIAAAAAIVAAFCAYLVVLLAGAAFAVSARRQQRSLAVAASVGAPRASVFRIVLLQGTVLGVVAGVVGAAIGVGLAAIALPVFDDGNAQSYWGFNVPWPLIIGVVLFAIVVATASAIMPARAATRGDVLAALRGARRPVSVRADRPLWGSLLVAVGLAVTAVSGLTLGALNAAEEIDYGNPLRQLAVIGVIAGPILFQIGVVLAGHWILSLLAKAGAYLGLAPRIATRDAAANPSRVVPAFGAIAACVFIASFALSAVGVYGASNAKNWWYSSPLGTVHVDVWTTYAGTDDMEDAAVAALEVTDPDRTAIVRGQSQMFETDEQGLPVGPEAETLFTPELVHYIDCDTIESGSCSQRASALLTAGWVHVIDEADLDVALGVKVPEAAIRAFRGGAAIVTDPDFIADGNVTINQWNRQFVDTYWQYYDPERPLDPLGSWRLTAAEVDLEHPLPFPVVVSPETAAELGMSIAPIQVIGAYDAPPTQERLDALAEVVAQPWGADGGLSYGMENGPPDTAPWLWLIIGATGVLVLGASAVTLGLARFERRPDDATLTAVGAPRRLRRGIAFWQGVVIVGVGAVTGTLAGLIPMWGITLMQPDSLNIGDAPWPWLAGLALGLPIAIAIANWLVPPRHPDLTRRTAIA